MSNESGPESTPRTAPETALAALRTSPANAGSRLGLSPLGVVLVCLFGLGMYLRLHYFGVPSTFQFDEHHFVENARRYIDHQTDLNDHPPLGKLMIAFSMRVLGDTPVERLLRLDAAAFAQRDLDRDEAVAALDVQVVGVVHQGSGRVLAEDLELVLVRHVERVPHRPVDDVADLAAEALRLSAQQRDAYERHDGRPG